MEQLLIVFIIELFFCLTSYILSDGVIINPTFLSYGVITVSTIFAIMGNISWGVKISDSLYLTIGLGLLSMLMAQLIAKKVTHKHKYKYNTEKRIIILIDKKCKTLFIALAVLLTFLYCADIIHAGKTIGVSGLASIFAVKKDKSGTNFLIRQGVKIVMALAYIHIFIFVNNYIINKKHSLDEAINILPALCGVICSIFTSVRTDILRLITAFLVDFCVLYFQSRHWNRKSLGSVASKIGPLVVFGALFMTGLKTIVKGTNNATSNNYEIIEYLCYYIGSPIIVLGSKLNSGLHNFMGKVFGENTFNQLLLLLQRIGFFNNVTLKEGSANVWIEESKRITANVDTIFGSPVIDFGVMGMAIYIFLIYLFINVFYYKKIQRTYNSKTRDFYVIEYSYLAILASMAYYTNYFNRFLTIYFVATLVLIKVLWHIYKVRYVDM